MPEIALVAPTRRVIFANLVLIISICSSTEATKDVIQRVLILIITKILQPGLVSNVTPPVMSVQVREQPNVNPVWVFITGSKTQPLVLCSVRLANILTTGLRKSVHRVKFAKFV